MNTKEMMRVELDAAKAIEEVARKDGRGLSNSDLVKIEQHMKRFDELKKELASEETLAKLKSIGFELGLEVNDRTTPIPALAGSGKSFKAAAAHAWARQLGSTLEKRAAGLGTKALVGATVNIPAPLGAPVTIDGPARTLLQLIPTESYRPVDGSAGNTYTTLRQTTRDLQARGVPDGTTKPTSDLDFLDDPGRFRVYATLAGPMPKRFLDDYAQLVQILGTQLGEGILEALEADIVSGTGVEVTTPGSENDPVQGILSTSGILVEPFATDRLTTMSNARYSLIDSNVTPTAWVMNSADFQALELLREGGATGPLLFGSGRSQIESFLGDVPIVISTAVPAGTAILGDFTKARLVVREEATLAFDSSGELFTKNQVVARMEGRYGFDVLLPSAFISVDLTA